MNFVEKLDNSALGVKINCIEFLMNDFRETNLFCYKCNYVLLVFPGLKSRKLVTKYIKHLNSPIYLQTRAAVSQDRCRFNAMLMNSLVRKSEKESPETI